MNSPTDTYYQDLQNLANAQDKAKLATLAAEYAGVLSRLPALCAELENLLSSTQSLDYQRLLERYEPALHQASGLFEVDRLPDELARDAQLQNALQLTLQTLTLANLTKSLAHFYSLKELLVEDKNRQEQTGTDRNRQEQTGTDRNRQERERAEAHAELKKKQGAGQKQKRKRKPNARPKKQQDCECPSNRRWRLFRQAVF